MRSSAEDNDSENGDSDELSPRAAIINSTTSKTVANTRFMGWQMRKYKLYLMAQVLKLQNNTTKGQTWIIPIWLLIGLAAGWGCWRPNQGRYLFWSSLRALCRIEFQRRHSFFPCHDHVLWKEFSLTDHTIGVSYEAWSSTNKMASFT